MNIFDAVGNTPMIRIGNIYIKLEHLNPSGSVKDRAVASMIQKYIHRKKFKDIHTLIECTSGNTGISLAMFASALKKRCVIYAPRNTSKNKLNMMRAYGATIVFTNDIAEGLEIVKKLSTCKGVLCLKQFNNVFNAVGQMDIFFEAMEQTNMKDIKSVILGTGTGGTLRGAIDAIHTKYPHIEFYQVLPSKGNIEGITDNVKMGLLTRHKDLINKVYVSEVDARVMKERLAKEKGLHVGVSSGANYLVAKMLSSKERVLTIFPDRGERYD